MTWVLECAIVIAIAYALVSSFGFRTTVVGNAMQDTLQSEEQIFVNRFVYMVRAPKQGDVVVFLPNGNEKSHYYVRRVIACPASLIKRDSSTSLPRFLPNRWSGGRWLRKTAVLKQNGDRWAS